MVCDRPGAKWDGIASFDEITVPAASCDIITLCLEGGDSGSGRELDGARISVQESVRSSSSSSLSNMAWNTLSIVSVPEGGRF